MVNGLAYGTAYVMWLLSSSYKDLKDFVGQ